MVVAAVGIVFWIRSAGKSLVAPERISLGHFATNSRAASVTLFTKVLLALAVIITTIRHRQPQNSGCFCAQTIYTERNFQSA